MEWENLDTLIISILFVMGIAILFSTLGYTILMVWFARKAFLSLTFLINIVCPWNGTNLDTHNSLHSFCYWHYNHVLHIRMHNTDALDLQEKLFFPPFSLQLMFTREMGQALILIIISILIVISTTIMFSLLGYMIVMLRICKKSFSFYHFPCN